MWGNHWVTLIIYPKEKRIVMYDFLYDENDENDENVNHKPRMEAVKKWWNKWTSDKLDKRASALPIAERGQYEIPDDGVVVHGRSNNSFGVQQTDGVSCGIYVCVLCKCIAEGCMPTPELMNKTTMSVQHRYMIAKEILDYHETLPK
jgi:Ulp1 family protease